MALRWFARGSRNRAAFLAAAAGWGIVMAACTDAAREHPSSGGGDAWFQGAIGKVAIYDFLLSQTQITNHYRVMTGKSPTGSCQDTCTF